jgi:hypothetical protein
MDNTQSNIDTEVDEEPSDPLDEYDKREIVVNCWLAKDKDPHKFAVAQVSGASEQDVSSILHDLTSGEIPEDVWQEIADPELQDIVEERMKAFEQTQHQQEEEEENTEQHRRFDVDLDEVFEDATKKERIIAAHKISGDATGEDVGDAVDASGEYVRQIYHDIDDRDQSEWVKLRPGDLDKEPHPELVEAVRRRLVAEGVVPGDGRESATKKDAVPREDIEDVKERLELLEAQAEFTGEKHAEFVASRAITWLDDILEDN